MPSEETVTLAGNIYVAPCLQCGGTDIVLLHNHDTSLNMGGGKCKKCGVEALAELSVNPRAGQMAAAWNAQNDTQTLIRKELGIIAQAQRRVLELKAKPWHVED
ncbi:hypothetical protein [Pseudomonas sp. S1(2024)]|uniref:hypothetical protein n=1 Tax=Pseudomonas sp. S1(2024) TaxID=3390191 RepID=UPI00397ABC5C